MRIRAFSAALFVSLFAGALADASEFTVNPTRIELTGRATSALLTVKNNGAAPVRLQMKTHTWTQTSDGQMALAPTDELVVFPTLLTLGPGEERKVRVAVTAKPSDVEQSYRVFLEEQVAPPGSGATGASVQMLTRVGIPVFLQPANPVTRAGLSDVGMSKAGLHFQIDNLGNTHFVPSQIRVRAFSGAGEPVTDKSTDGWYILGRGTRRYDLPFEAGDCHRIRSLLIEVQVGDTPIKSRLETPNGACAS